MTGPQLPVNWVKNSNNNQWFDLLRLNLNASYFNDKEGVYVIWYAGPAEAKAIRVGQGNIGDRLREHRTNPEIIRYAHYGQLKVSWAIVPKQYRDGVEAYLFDSYNPLIGDRSPTAQPISVNLI
jgi:hypothetical protein